MKFHTLEDFAVRMSETDAAGVVHFSHFLRWAENAEGDFFRKNGLKIFGKTAAGTHFGWPRVSVRFDFRAPARYADSIRVRIRPAAFPPENARSVEWRSEIFRVGNAGDLLLLATGTWTSVFAEIDDGAKMRAAAALPAEIRAALKTFFEE